MAYISGAFGVRGSIKVVADTEYADSLFDYPTWWLGRDGRWQRYTFVEGQIHSKVLIATLDGVDDRDKADSLRGCTIAVPRSEMPEADENEYYWTDLVGMAVRNVAGEYLGTVVELFETGANDVLVVRDAPIERLIPFVASVVLTVDDIARTITVDWGLDF
ncbi:ribosome maturation factor RimM [Parachitinimonas caeni]|nr:ribosome maturation factor RimM [Parachitinimonas caeni]